MPRINVEESFWGDQRLEVLKGKLGRFASLGACLAAWRLAQKYWNGSCKPIPKDVWITTEMPNELIEVGLARETPEGVYVSGSEAWFEWYHKRIEAGKVGGRASASKRQAPLEQSSSTARPSVKQKQPSSSSSSSSSSSKTEDIYTVRATEILKQLNKIAGTKHELDTESSLRFVTDRFKQYPHLTDSDFINVIRAKAKEWKDDKKMRKYLRPETLFNATKFASYLSEGRIHDEEDKEVAKLFGEDIVDV